MKIKNFKEFGITETMLEIPNLPNTMNFWHGGNLDDYYGNNFILHKKGQYEYGPGLYLTTHYGTAKLYAKGSRKLYLVTVNLGNNLDDSYLDYQDCVDFIKHYCVTSLRKEVITRLSKFNENGKVNVGYFNNIILNNDAIKGQNVTEWRKFYINNKIDYSIVSNPFGWGEEMMVLYNMYKIENVRRVLPTDEIVNFDLHKMNK